MAAALIWVLGKCILSRACRAQTGVLGWRGTQQGWIYEAVLQSSVQFVLLCWMESQCFLLAMGPATCTPCSQWEGGELFTLS